MFSVSDYAGEACRVLNKVDSRNQSYRFDLYHPLNDWTFWMGVIGLTNELEGLI
jgi:hypothetical protein